MEGLLLDTAPVASPSQWAVLCVAVLATLYMVVVRPMRKRRQRDPLSKPPSQASLTQQKAVERDLARLLIEYEQMIRQMTAQVDTRAAKLELLIKDAHRAAADVNTALAAARVAGLTALPAVGPHEPAKEPDGPAGGVLAASAAAGNRDQPAPAEAEPRHEEIYSLADGGQSARQIAQRLNRPHGEIELILALRSRAT